MKLLLKVLLFIVLGAYCASANVVFVSVGNPTPSGPPPVTTACLYPTTAAVDGCSNANPNSSVIHSNGFAVNGYFNTIAGTTTNYSTTRIPNNAAAVDYPVGAYISLAQAKDPIASPPPGCYAALTTPGGKLLVCGNPYAVVSGYITNTTGTNATLVIGSFLYGNTSQSSNPVSPLTIVGPPQVSAGTVQLSSGNYSSYAITPNTTSAAGSSAAPINIQLGAAGSTGIFNGMISGYNFGAAFGHGCTAIYVPGNSVNLSSIGINVPVVTITNNYMTNDGNCGVNWNQEYMVTVGSFSYETDFTYNTFNGQGVKYPWNTCNGVLDNYATCNGAAALSSQGTVKIEYNAFVDFAARTIYCNLGSGGTTNYIFKYNYIEGWDYHPFNGHTEFLVCNGNGNAGFDGEYNTIIQTVNGMEFGPSPFFLASTWAVDFTGGINISNNTVIGANLGNGSFSAVTSGCIGGDSSCTTPGTNFYVSSTAGGTGGGNGNIGHGEQLGGAQGGPTCSVANGTATVTSITAPSGGVSTVTITGTTVGLIGGGTITMPSSSGYGTAAMSFKSITTGIGGAGTIAMYNSNTGAFSGTATATVTSPNITAWINANLGGGFGAGSSWNLDSGSLPPSLWLAGPATCTNLQIWSPSSNTYVWQGTSYIRHVSTLTIQNNYIDGSTSWVPRNGQSWVIFIASGNGVSFNGTINGTTLTVNSGSYPSLGQYIVGAGILGCTADPTTCPYAASGGSGTYTLSASGGTVGPEAMTGELPFVCGAPETVQNNIDMAGIATSVSMDPTFSSLAYTHGC